MSEPAAILATFSDLKLIRGRKVAQLVFEIPIEQAQGATNALGFPNPAIEQWYGIARVQNSSAGGLDPVHPAKGQPSSREVPPAKPNIRRAMAMVRDFEFREFAGTTDDHGTLEFIRKSCGIKSRTELDVLPGSEAFSMMCADFAHWRRARAA